jgi:hypothetical protein
MISTVPIDNIIVVKIAGENSLPNITGTAKGAVTATPIPASRPITRE